METIIKSLPKQLEFEAEIKNSEKLKRFTNFVVGGMGGSALSSGILKRLAPDILMITHKNYHLPLISNRLPKDTLYIASSYSGNTEEVLSFAREAIEKKLDVAVITKGGKLLEIAIDNKLPYVVIPDDGLEPRFALGYSLVALSKLCGRGDVIENLRLVAPKLEKIDYAIVGLKLVEKIDNLIPLIYASAENEPLAYVWKIKFNETAKKLAFSNVMPEMNHNELVGFDEKNTSVNQKNNFIIVILRDKDDDVRIIKRISIISNLLKNRGYKFIELDTQGNTLEERVLSSVTLADFVTFEMAKRAGIDPLETTIISELKREMAG